MGWGGGLGGWGAKAGGSVPSGVLGKRRGLRCDGKPRDVSSAFVL